MATAAWGPRGNEVPYTTFHRRLIKAGPAIPPCRGVTIKSLYRNRTEGIGDESDLTVKWGSGRGIIRIPRPPLRDATYSLLGAHIHNANLVNLPAHWERKKELMKKLQERRTDVRLGENL